MNSRQPKYNSDSAGDNDQLLFDRDTRLISQLILSVIEPPFSIGVFGRQGWGRTFFLNRLEESLNNMAIDSQTSLVHVHFNALLNAETNPWIALIDAVYRALERAVEKRFSGKDTRIQTFENLGGTAERLNAQAMAKVLSAESAVKEAEEALDEAKKHHEDNLKELARVKSWQRWQEIEKGYWEKHISAIKRYGKRLGIDDLDQRPEDLHNLLTQAKSIDGLASIINSSMTSTPWFGTFSAIFVGIIGAALLAGVTYLLLGSYKELKVFIDLFGKTLGIVGSVLGGIGALALVVLRNRARSAIRSLWEHRDRLRNAERDADRDHLFESAQVEEAVTVSRDALARVRERTQRAHHQLILAEREFEEFLKPGILRRVIEFYRTTLVSEVALGAGIVPVLREDIEALFDWLNWHGSLPQSVGAGAIDRSWNTRIVVYMDDLDRCPPEHVFALLQASNLLLSTPLFVVAMVMDPITTMRALKSRYTPLLESSEDVAVDYLERLVQIPFWLSRPTRESIDMFLQHTAKPIPSEAGESCIEPVCIQDEPVFTEDQVPVSDEPAFTMFRIDFEFTLQQFEFIRRLLSVFAVNPRTIKRFINLCRVGRAELQVGGHDDAPQDFMAVATLLAIVVGIPKAAPTVFELIDQGKLGRPADCERRLFDVGVTGSSIRAVSQILDAFYSDVAETDGLPLLQRARTLAAKHSFNVPPLSQSEWEMREGGKQGNL